MPVYYLKKLPALGKKLISEREGEMIFFKYIYPCVRMKSFSVCMKFDFLSVAISVIPFTFPLSISHGHVVSLSCTKQFHRFLTSWYQKWFFGTKSTTLGEISKYFTRICKFFAGAQSPLLHPPPVMWKLPKKFLPWRVNAPPCTPLYTPQFATEKKLPPPFGSYESVNLQFFLL